MAAKALTFAEFKAEVGKRLNGTVSQSDLNRMFTAFTEEMIDCLVNGYKVSIPGVLAIEPIVKQGRKKGTLIRNPFDKNDPGRKLRADEPDKFAIKLSKSAALAKHFPSLRSKDGQELFNTLAAKPTRRAAPKPKAAASGRKTTASKKRGKK